MKTKHHVLFVTEKWFNGHPKFSFTNNFHNLFNTFSSAVGEAFSWNTIHIDESYSIYGKHVDEIILNYCLHNNVVAVFYSLLGTDPRNPTIKTYEALKNAKIKQCFMWPDTADWAIQKIKELNGLSDLHISWDNPSIPIEYSSNHVSMWVPQDQFLFYPDEQKIDVIFSGSKHQQDRIDYLNFLIQNLENISITGGQAEEMLSPQMYAFSIRKSKINLNFPMHPFGFDQVKGRVFEVLACKSLLLEKHNEETKKILIPNEEYIEFFDPQDALNKIKYFLKNEEHRMHIASKGYKKYRDKYSSDIFWKTIINKLFDTSVYEINNNF